MMKVNKNMIIALTITFCFIAAMFMVIPIRSQSSGQYDPWLDINDDGKISMDEIVAATTAFGAKGDPTKNVTVTNWPNYDLQQGTINMSGEAGQDGLIVPYGGLLVVSCGGYSRLALSVKLTNTNFSNLYSNGSVSTLTTYLEGIYWHPVNDFSGFHDYSYETPLGNAFNFTMYSEYEPAPWQTWVFWSDTTRPYMTEIKAPYCGLVFNFNGTNLPTNWWVTFDYSLYLRNE
jgi:hypothetical protein